VTASPREVAAAESGSWLRRLVNGTWLNRGRVGLVARLLLAIELAGFAFIVAGTHGWIVPLDAPTTTDFVSFYAAGALADAGTPALAYDHAAHLAAEERAVGAGIGYQYFNYPPIFLLVCALLAPLPYLVAFVLFETATLLLYLFAGTRILADRGTTAFVALLAFPIVFWNYGLGQNAFLTAGLFGFATCFIERRPVLAGVLFGLLCYKPQFGLLLPLALAAGRHWRVFAAAAVTVVAAIAVSVACFGIETWHAFFAAAGSSPTMYSSGRILFIGMANTFGGIRMLGGGVTLAYALQALATAAAAGIVVVVWRGRTPAATKAAVLCAGALVAAPLSLLYDLMLGAIAGCWLVRSRRAAAAAPWEMTALAALYLVQLDGRNLAEGMLRLPVFPLSAILLLAIAAGRAWRDMRHPEGSGETAQLCGNRISSRS